MVIQDLIQTECLRLTNAQSFPSGSLFNNMQCSTDIWHKSATFSRLEHWVFISCNKDYFKILQYQASNCKLAIVEFLVWALNNSSNIRIDVILCKISVCHCWVVVRKQKGIFEPDFFNLIQHSILTQAHNFAVDWNLCLEVQRGQLSCIVDVFDFYQTLTDQCLLWAKFLVKPLKQLVVYIPNSAVATICIVKNFFLVYQ